jgi:hypothetical protein
MTNGRVELIDHKGKRHEIRVKDISSRSEEGQWTRVKLHSGFEILVPNTYDETTKILYPHVRSA